jgi:hypothetical protein
MPVSGQRTYDWLLPQLITLPVQLEAVIDREMAVTRTAVRVLQHLPPKAGSESV